MAKRSTRKLAGTKSTKKTKPHTTKKKSGLPDTIKILERALNPRSVTEPPNEEVMVPSARTGGDPTVSVIWSRLRVIFGMKVFGDTELEPLLYKKDISLRALPNHINRSDGFRQEGLHLVYADIANAVYLADIGVAIAKWYRNH